jgi:alcohol dehydrogenase class IV
MQAFEFFGVTRTVLGRGSVARLGELAAGLGRAALVVHNGPIGRVEELLGAAGVSGTIHRQRGEPVVADVDAAVDLGRRHRCDCVIGVGGGSALDVAKAAAGLLRNDGSVLDYMEVVGKGRKLAHPAAPWMAVPATAGTGAEATRNAVIGLPQKRFKASIRSEHLLARVALVDPELGVSVSAAVTASSGMDALCQLIESYTSSGASPVTDALALKGLGMAARNLPRVFHDGGDVSAREQMALAALLSGMTLTSAGLGAVHGLAAPLGANFPAPHGTICAALLPYIIAANVRALREQTDSQSPGLARYADIGRQFPGLETAGNDQAIDGCVQFISDLARELDIPPLNRFGVGLSDVGEMVALARKASSTRFNPVVLSDEAMAEALAAAIGPGLTIPERS